MRVIHGDDLKFASALRVKPQKGLHSLVCYVPWGYLTGNAVLERLP